MTEGTPEGGPAQLDAGEINQFISWVHLTLGDEGVFDLANKDDAHIQELLNRYYADYAATEGFKYWSRSTEPQNRGRDDV
jgi:hypothetical protein